MGGIIQKCREINVQNHYMYLCKCMVDVGSYSVCTEKYFPEMLLLESYAHILTPQCASKMFGLLLKVRTI